MFLVKPLIMGGLGNQLFMIANAYAYALRNNFEFILDDKKDCGPRPVYYDNLLINLRKYIKDTKSEFVKIVENGDSILQKFNYNIEIEGYYQSEIYFDDYEKEIRELFEIPQNIKEKTKEKLKLMNLEGKTLVAIHIRRTDFLDNNYFNVMNVDYYEKSKKNIEEKLGFRPTYVYFGDDKEWILQNFTNIGDFDTNDKIVEMENDYEEFVLMVQCNHFIIANSTFSWWASWLNKNNEKIIICPIKWFNSNNIWWSKIFCKDFILI